MGELAIGEKLLEVGLITKTQLESAKAMHTSIGGPIGPILAKLGYISEDKLLKFVAEQEGLKSISIDNVELSGELMITFERKFLQENEVLPLKRTGTTLTIAVADATNMAAIENVRFLTGLNVETVLMSRREIQQALNNFFYREDSRRLARQPLERQDVHELARELQSAGLHEGKLAEVPDAAPAAPPEVLRSLTLMMIDKGLVTRDELKEIVAEVESRGDA